MYNGYNFLAVFRHAYFILYFYFIDIIIFQLYQPSITDPFPIAINDLNLMKILISDKGRRTCKNP